MLRGKSAAELISFSSRAISGPLASSYTPWEAYLNAHTVQRANMNIVPRMESH